LQDQQMAKIAKLPSPPVLALDWELVRLFLAVFR
jgi:hypothetical protein